MKSWTPLLLFIYFFKARSRMAKLEAILCSCEGEVVNSELQNEILSAIVTNTVAVDW